MDVSGFMGGNFLTHLDLLVPFLIQTIGKVGQQLVGQGKNAEQKICITFNENNKPLALNKTNLKRIAALYTTDANAWIGKQLLVYRSSTTFGNETVLCVRVCGPTQTPPDPIYDPQGNAVLFQSVAQPAPAPMPQQPAPVQGSAPPPVAAVPQAVQQQPPVAPSVAAPWDQRESSPPSA